MMDNDEFSKVEMISEKEAAKRYPYSAIWFRRKRSTGGGVPFIKFSNGKVLYRVKDLDKYFDSFPTRVSTAEYKKK